MICIIYKCFILLLLFDVNICICKLVFVFVSAVVNK